LHDGEKGREEGGGQKVIIQVLTPYAGKIAGTETKAKKEG